MNSKNIEPLVRLPDQIGWPVTCDSTWYPTANISASGTHPEAIISATQTVPVHPSSSPNAVPTLLNRSANKPSSMNHEGTETGDLPRLPRVMSELTRRLMTSRAETNPYSAI